MERSELTVGTVVENFSTTAVVVGHSHDGWPVLREVGLSSGKLRGGKWAADPAKCRRAAFCPRCMGPGAKAHREGCGCFARAKA